MKNKINTKKQPGDLRAGLPADATIQSLQAGWQRTQADFENFKKRTEQEKSRWQEDAKIDVFSRLLPLLDNISLAAKHTPKSIENDPWVQGIAHISRQIDQELSELSVFKVDVKPGDQFDHNFHEAIETRSDKSYNNDQIIEVRSDGYLIDKKLIRPARVVTCKND